MCQMWIHLSTLEFKLKRNPLPIDGRGYMFVVSSISNTFECRYHTFQKWDVTK